MAIVNETYSIIVGTQAKCGSTSLEKMLLRQEGWEYRLPKHLPPDEAMHKHYEHRLMQVRNPYDRFWSIYRWNVKRAPHEALSHLVEYPDKFVAEFYSRWSQNKWRTFTLTQEDYAEEFRATRFAKLEDGGLVPMLREITGEDLPDLPELNVNRTHLERPALSKDSLHFLSIWANPDMEAFGYERC